MTRPPALALLLLVLAAAPAAAQRRVAVPVQTKSKSLDPVRQQYHDVLWQVRDSLGAVLIATSRLRRDASMVSNETVLSRAADLRRRCAAAIRTVSGAAPVFDAAKAPRRPPALPEHVRKLARALQAVRESLDQECVRGFAARGPGAWPDSLRAWAGFRGGKIDHALRAYDSAVGEFTKVAGITLEPHIESDR